MGGSQLLGCLHFLVAALVVATLDSFRLNIILDILNPTV